MPISDTSTIIRKSNSGATPGGWNDARLERDHIEQELEYGRKQLMEEEAKSYKDYNRRLKAAEIRQKLKRRRTKRAEDEQKAMEAAKSFAMPIHRKGQVPPKKLVSL
ncbi:hypothetical protein OESDEN_12256 [Oesophagostomum dentatum]|uniref:Uncharacterized protein n=1 Tax=Oesophagostomum dentatum TaxID=61180 RepID=A0A0B1SVN3_OESDE|nr:hypothetical protein OESDEN_12256 [Oesophagostomum dentatum]